MAEEIVYISEGRPSLTQEALDKELKFLGIDSETFLKQYGYSVKKNGVAETGASATPDNNQALNQKGVDTGSNWDQDSLDTSNTEEAKPIDNVRYIKFKSGAVVYEDEYLDKYAGTERFPASFDDYAAKLKQNLLHLPHLM